MTSIGASRPASRDSQGQGKPKGNYGSARSRLKSNGNDSAAPQAPTPAVLKFSCVRASRLVLSAAQGRKHHEFSGIGRERERHGQIYGRTEDLPSRGARMKVICAWCTGERKPDYIAEKAPLDDPSP